MTQLGSYAVHLKALTRPALDGRRKEARLMRSMREEFIGQLGHPPNAGELALIERLAWLQLRMQILDKKLVDGSDTRLDVDCYLAHVNTFAKTLAHLKLRSPQQAMQEPGDRLKVITERPSGFQPPPGPFERGGGQYQEHSRDYLAMMEKLGKARG